MTARDGGWAAVPGRFPAPVWLGALTFALVGVLACRTRQDHAAERTTVEVPAPRAPLRLPDSLFPPPTRPVSSIVSPRWSNEDERDDAGEARTVLDLAGVTTGTAVADIGAGDGYYTLRAARLVGAGGRVWAEDIRADYLDLLRARLAAAPAPNVVLALGEPGDPRLPANAVDVALMIHMYHEITQPFALLANLAPSLRPGARLVVVDQERPTNAHGTPTALLRCEVTAMGYRWRERRSLTDGAYTAVFDAPVSPDSLTPPSRLPAVLAARRCDTATGPE